MSTEKLIVQLESDTKQLQADLIAIKAKLEGLEDPIQRNENKFKKMAASALNAGQVIATAAAAAVTAMSAVIISTAKSAQEVENLATTAKTTTDNFKAMAFAFEQYNVDAKGTADAMNDVSERLGEFSKAGTGAFQDFADVMGMTKEEAQKFATEIKYLSGEDAILEMVKRMEDANVSGAEMSFVMKSMSNDLEYASAAFSDNGKILKELKSNYNDATAAMQLTSAEAEIMQSTAVSFSLATKTLSQSATQISAQLAPEFESFFNYVIDKVPQATQGIINFLNSMKDPDAITNIESVDDQIRTASVSISNLLVQKKALESSMIDIDAGSGGAQGAGIIEAQNAKTAEGLDLVNRKIQEQYDLLGELGERRQTLTTEQAEADAKEAESAEAISQLKIDAENKKAEVLADLKKKEIEGIENRFKSERELLDEQYAKELELATGNEDLILELKNEYNNRIMELDEESDLARYEAQMERWREMIEEQSQEKFDKEIEEQQKLLDQKLINEEDYLKSVNKIAEKYGKVDAATTKKNNETKADSTWDYADSAMNAAGTLFENNKAVSSTLAFINTAEGVTAALAKYDYIGAALIAATGATQIAAINSATVGTTGSVTSPSSTSASTNDSRVSSSVEINETVASGVNSTSTSSTLTVTSDNTDTLSTAMAEVLQDMIKRGEIKGFG